MSAIPLMKINDRLTPFASNGGGEAEHSPLADLDVFHTRFSNVDGLPQGSDVEPEKTYAQGLEEGRLLAASEGVVHLETAAELVQSLQQNLAALGTQIQASHSRAIMTILRAVLPQLAEQAAGAEIHNFLERIAGQTLHGEVTLHVNPTHEQELSEIVQTISKGGFTAPDFTIVTDESLGGHAVNAQWNGGGGVIDIDGAVQNCLTLLTPTDEA